MRAGQQKLLLWLGLVLVAMLFILLSTEGTDSELADTEEQPSEKALFEGVGPNEITGLTFVPRDGERVAAVRDAEGWVLREPFVGLADGESFEALATRLVELRSQAAVYTSEEGRSADALSGFGLGQSPRVLVTASRRDGFDLVVRIGDDTPVGYASYVQIGEQPDVLPANGHLAELFEAPPSSYREAAAWRVDPDAVTGLRWSYGTEGYALSQTDGVWAGVDVGSKGAEDAVTSLLRAICDLRVSTFDVQESQPMGEVVLSTASGERRMIIGADTLVVKSPLHDAWVQLEADVVDLLRSFDGG